MNKKAREIGMHNTEFHSVHGLPPSGKNPPDVTTARDMAKLSRELLKYPEAVKYTSTKVREFRPDAPEPFIMRTHNHLLKDFEGCDGLKTGYFSAAGFSICATAQKKDARAIAVVLGSASSKERDKQARLLLSKGLMEILINSLAPEVVEKEPEQPEIEYVQIPKTTFRVAMALNVAVIIFLFAALFFRRSKGNRMR
jgi:D-alanyl-D-alanine carboxypeptidase (penicillin-binding protein 5/6)